MIRQIIILWATGAVLAGCAATPTPDEEFARIDTNCDACISWQEYKVYRPGAKRDTFLRNDQNHDEKLDIGEWRMGAGYAF